MGNRTAQILEPKRDSVFCFGEEVSFRAKATEKTQQGIIDISHLIEWRKPCRKVGPRFAMSFKNRDHATVAIYINGVRKDSISLKIICCPYNAKKPPTQEESLLARIILGEGESCSFDERCAIGYVAVNRYRFHPKYFRSNLKDVVYQKGQFGGIETPMFLLLDSSKNVAAKLTYGQCERFRETLAMARDILNDHASRNAPLFIATGKHAFFFNKAHNTPPALKLSPLLVSNKASGWKHSFYGYAP